jgi:hypothetical protein
MSYAACVFAACVFAFVCLVVAAIALHEGGYRR